MSSLHLTEANDLFLGCSDSEFEMDADLCSEQHPSRRDEGTPTSDEDATPSDAHGGASRDLNLKRKASSQDTLGLERATPVQRLDARREVSNTPALFQGKIADKLNGIKLVDVMLGHG